MLPPGPRTRANVGLEPSRGGAGDPDLVPGRGLFAPPERFDQRPFSAADAARTVTETTVETLRARGEPARYERILGEVLVGLDRAGQLRRLAAATVPATDAATGWRAPGRGERGSRTTRPGRRHADPATWHDAGSTAVDGADGRLRVAGQRSVAPLAGRCRRRRPGRAASSRSSATSYPTTQRRVVEIEPGRWWLADREDRDAAAVPLADRVEWAVFSLLSTAGPISETAFYERIASLFTGHDLPDEGLVRACLDSYRSLASTPED